MIKCNYKNIESKLIFFWVVIITRNKGRNCSFIVDDGDECYSIIPGPSQSHLIINVNAQTFVYTEKRILLPLLLLIRLLFVLLSFSVTLSFLFVFFLSFRLIITFLPSHPPLPSPATSSLQRHVALRLMARFSSSASHFVFLSLSAPFSHTCALHSCVLSPHLSRKRQTQLFFETKFLRIVKRILFL